MTQVSKVRKIAFVGDHLPRKCGIVTFTSDLLPAVAGAHPQCQCFSVSVNDIQGGYEYPEVVRFEIEEQGLSSYQRAADFLNISNVDVVCLQQEFGIFGGPAGGHILALQRELRMPVVRRNAPSTGSSAGTILDWSSILLKQAAVAMGSTWIGAIGTRGRNQLWPSCFRWGRCAWRKICWRVLGNRSPSKSNRRFRSCFCEMTSP